MEHQKNYDKDQPKEFVEKLIKLNRTAKVVPQGTDGTDGHHIGDGKDGGKLAAVFQQLSGGLVAILTGETDALVIPFGIKVNAVLPEGDLAAFVPQAADIRGFPVAADDGNVPVTAGHKGIDGTAGSLPVVGGDAGKVIKMQR